jgi:hypothetical protein
MLLPLLVSLTTSQVLVIAGVDVPVASVLASDACKTRTCIDGSSIYNGLFPGSPGFTPRFEGLRAAPIAGWPTELNGAWVDGLAACREEAGGESSSGPTLVIASECGERLAWRLWADWLSHQKATHVAVFRSGGNLMKPTVTLWWSEFPSKTRTTLSAPSPRRERDAQLLKLLADAEAQKGARAAWVLPPPPEEPIVVTFAVPTVVKTPVKDARSCDAAPLALRFSSPGVITESVAARWVASVKGKAAPRACAFTQRLRQGGSTKFVTLVVSCHDAAAMFEIDTEAPTAVVDASGQLVKQLAARWCR